MTVEHYSVIWLMFPILPSRNKSLIVVTVVEVGESEDSSVYWMIDLSGKCSWVTKGKSFTYVGNGSNKSHDCPDSCSY